MPLYSDQMPNAICAPMIYIYICACHIWLLGKNIGCCFSIVSLQIFQSRLSKFLALQFSLFLVEFKCSRILYSAQFSAID